MKRKQDILERVAQAAEKRILFLQHALSQMNIPDRMISIEEVRAAIFDGVLVEEYPDDPRGHSCLLLGQGVNDRPIHVVCAPKREYLAVITAYVPDPRRWEADWKTRKEK
jgi:hypothetical protein